MPLTLSSVEFEPTSSCYDLLFSNFGLSFDQHPDQTRDSSRLALTGCFLFHLSVLTPFLSEILSVLKVKLRALLLSKIS